VQLGGLGERCKFPQRGLGLSLSRNRIWCVLAWKSDILWRQFLIFPNFSLTIPKIIFFPDLSLTTQIPRVFPVFPDLQEPRVELSVLPDYRHRSWRRRQWRTWPECEIFHKTPTSPWTRSTPGLCKQVLDDGGLTSGCVHTSQQMLTRRLLQPIQNFHATTRLQQTIIDTAIGEWRKR